MNTQIYSTLKPIAVSFCVGIKLLGITVLAGKFKPHYSNLFLLTVNSRYASPDSYRTGNPFRKADL